MRAQTLAAQRAAAASPGGALAAALDKNLAGAVFVTRAGHLAPGLTIFLKLPFAFALGIEAQSLSRSERGGGHDVPDVFRDDVGDQEIDFCGRVGAGAAGVLDAVTAFGEALSGFHLHAPVVVAGVDDEVVALAVAPGFGDTEAEAGGFGEKRGFGDFPAAFAGGEANGMDFGNHLRRIASIGEWVHM